MITLNYPIAGGDFDSAGLATRKLKEQLARLGVDASAMRRVMIASYEAEMNVVIHARTGTLWARLDVDKLDLEVADEGPGIPDVELAMREGWSTAPERARQMGFGAGLGLPNIRKASDLFQIETRVGRGTRIRSTILFHGGEAGPAVAFPASGAVRPALGVDDGRCRGCRRCIFTCPTGALRLRDRRPTLLDPLCVGCTACIEECPDGVFSIAADAEPNAGALRNVPQGALLIAPRGFFVGFPGFRPPELILSGLRQIGFSEVRFLEEWEESLRRESRHEAAAGKLPRPRIPPLCPPVVSLIEGRFPSLIPHLVPCLSPSEAACEEFPLRPVFLAAACPGQYRACAWSSLTERLTVATPAALANAVLPLLNSRRADGELPAVRVPRANPAGPRGLAASGVRSVLRLLSRAETGALADVSVLELHLCAGGCSASPLLTSNPELNGFRWTVEHSGEPPAAARRNRPYEQRQGVRLDPDMTEAIRKLAEIDGMTHRLPGRDCGSCGSPSCAAFAEDVVMRRAAEGDCPFMENAR